MGKKAPGVWLGNLACGSELGWLLDLFSLKSIRRFNANPLTFCVNSL
jgi:hypothetical protein